MVSQRNDCSCHWRNTRHRVDDASLFFFLFSSNFLLTTRVHQRFTKQRLERSSSSVVRELYRFAIVEELAGFGAAVHTCSRNETKLDECIREWESKGFRVTGSVCDVSCRTQRDKLIEKVSSTFQGKLNILVCSSPHQFEAVSNLILILKINKSS